MNGLRIGMEVSRHIVFRRMKELEMLLVKIVRLTQMDKSVFVFVVV